MSSYVGAKTTRLAIISAVLAFGTLLLPYVFGFSAGVERIVRLLGGILALVMMLILCWAMIRSR
jgi:uncharacterized membrane protein